jgi:ubiquinone biosynthesis UbiH/UbiF/VisC/COQ6 family hydroxylase
VRPASFYSGETMRMDFDLIVVGGGPNGLCFARALAGSGLSVAIVDQQPRSALADPAFDGREIALTQHSVELLRRMGVWERIPANERHLLRAARVLNGNDPQGIEIQPEGPKNDSLGWLVSNHLIRRAAFEALDTQPGLHWFDGLRPIAVDANADCAEVQLANGQLLRGRLLVAADSRFSETRRALGVPADMEDFGKSMLVCRMQHEVCHAGTAWEWFGFGQTLALLPLGERTASAVLTLPQTEIERLMAMDDAAFGTEITRRFDGRLGAMQPVSRRHAYPLVGVYPRQFVGSRFALIGDAAVGMHPVTAHGFNFGLLGVDLLAQRVRRAHAMGLDIANARDLAGYQRELRRATRPLYLATRAIARLYTCDSAPARLLRRAGIAFGARALPFRRALAGALSASGDSRAQTRPLKQGLMALF